jgi:hypothetical protein
MPCGGLVRDGPRVGGRWCVGDAEHLVQRLRHARLGEEWRVGAGMTEPVRCAGCWSVGPDVSATTIAVDVQRPGAKSARTRSRTSTLSLCHRCWATMELDAVLGLMTASRHSTD